MLESKAVAAI